MKNDSRKFHVKFWIGVTAFALMLCSQTAEAQTNTFPSSGSAGIGTTTPAGALEVKASQPDITLNHTNSANYSRIAFRESDSEKAAVQFIGSTFSTTNRRNAIELANNWGPILFFTHSGGYGTERFRIAADGNVGIGTTTPGYRLHIRGDNTSGGGFPLLKLENAQTGGHSWWLYSGANGVAGDLGIYDESASAYRFNITSTGNVGIATTTPTAKFHVLETGNTALSVVAENTNSGASSEASLAVKNDVGYAAFELFSSGYATTAMRRKALFTTDANQTGGLGFATLGSAPITFLTNSSGSSNERMRIDSSGNVGIGTVSPSAKLHVVGNGTVDGNLTVTGNIAAKYQDVAEWVESSQSLTRGTVVVLDQTRSNQVIASTQAYDTRVAGVISLQPGIALGESGAGKVLVATTGRVRIKVDASRAAIKIGDLLVTSDVAGVAMKSQAIEMAGVQMHRPGTLIGKALEPLEKGTGEILVLLSLQ